MRSLRIAFYAAFFAAIPSFAATVASVRGIIHDPQHRPVQNAMVMIKATSSDWSAQRKFRRQWQLHLQTRFRWESTWSRWRAWALSRLNKASS